MLIGYMTFMWLMIWQLRLNSSLWWTITIISIRSSQWLEAMEDETHPTSDTITLVAEGRHFLCHKTSLMNGSDYFKAMFSSNFSENDKKLIELQVISHLTFAGIQIIPHYLLFTPCAWCSSHLYSRFQEMIYQHLIFVTFHVGIYLHSL